MKRRKACFPVAAEVCESRTLLAATAVAAFSNGVLTVGLSGGAKIRIDQVTSGALKVSSMNGATINGGATDFVVQGVNSVVVNMDAPPSYDLRNVVRIGTETLLHTTILGNVTVDMGGDYNRLYFENTEIKGNVSIEQSSEDYVEFEQTVVDGTVQYFPLD